MGEGPDDGAQGIEAEIGGRLQSPCAQADHRTGLLIVVNMGDQDSDLAGGYAERTFKLPDPFYYVP